MNLKNKVLLGVVSATLFASASMWEGVRYTPYEDVVGVLTVCKGHTGPDVIKGKVWTPKQCDDLLEKQLGDYGRAVLKCVNVPLTPYQYDAYTLFAYNVGTNAFCTSKSVLAPLNRGDYKASCDGLLKWVYADGKYVQGLANRRAYERKMCLGELDAK